ncbi:MAG TPA: ABC transporter ATP-binding protein [Spirochaetota bacterium]|nr:ABC transporter ATP-binding protein [Spirochaetota bacterium]HPS87121.1 ABC transporter ATP-binding protein [Spirochaetota bacterium]
MVLSDISFSINKGEAVALVGENGAGKTTLIRILSLILKPDKGSASLDNISFSDNPGYIKNRTGTLFSGDGALYDRLSAKENILYYAQLNGVKKTVYNRMLETLTDDLSLKDFINDKVSTFSRGMKQRTALARTLITNPDFVILDEPSTGLDIIACNSVKKIINGLKAGGKTVLFSSHSTDEIFSCADRIIVIHKGKINCDKTSGSYQSEHGKDLTFYIK